MQLLIVRGIDGIIRIHKADPVSADSIQPGAFNAGTNGGYQIAYICAIVGGIANSFLDTGIYPAVGEIIYKAPGVATMGIKFFIAIAQMILPFVLGATVDE